MAGRECCGEENIGKITVKGGKMLARGGGSRRRLWQRKGWEVAIATKDKVVGFWESSGGRGWR